MFKSTLLEAMASTLNDWFPDDPVEPLLPYETKSEDLSGPVYSLIDNPAMLIELFSQAADLSGQIDNRSAFSNRLSASRSLPRPPDIDEERFTPPARYTKTDERKMARSILYNRALIAHQKNTAKLRARIDETNHIIATYPKGADGYLQYACDKLHSLEPLIAQRFLTGLRPVRFSLLARQRHSFISGGTGSGKSETAKSLIRHYLTNDDENDCAIIVLDPHGKLAWEMARMSEVANSGRLIFIDPTTGPITGRQITFNPFELSDRSETSIEQQTQQLTDAFLQVIVKPTELMENLLRHAITALLYRGNADISHFIQFMSDDENPETGKPYNEILRKYAAKNLPMKSHRDFFQYAFRSQNLSPSKQGLSARFSTLIAPPPVQRFLCGPSTFDLEAAIDEKKVIIANLQIGVIGKKSATLLGQFLTAYINSYAARRMAPGCTKPQHSIHLFADECQYFVSGQTSQILEQARKNHFDISLITQSTHQIEPASILSSLFTNAGVLLVGTNKGPTVSAMERNAEIPGEEIRRLATGEFILQEVKTPGQRHRPYRQIRMPHIANRYDIGDSAWREVLAHNLTLYYRSITGRRPAISKETDAPSLRPVSSAPPLPEDDQFYAAIRDNKSEFKGDPNEP